MPSLGVVNHPRNIQRVAPRTCNSQSTIQVVSRYLFDFKSPLSSHSNPLPISRGDVTKKESQPVARAEIEAGRFRWRPAARRAEIRSIADHAVKGCVLHGHSWDSSALIPGGSIAQASSGVTNRRRTTARVVACGGRASWLGRKFSGAACIEHGGRERARDTEHGVAERYDTARHLEHVATTLDRT